MRIKLSDPTRLDELCDFFQSVHAVATRNAETVVVDFPGVPRPAHTRQLRAYLQTWLALTVASGHRVEADVYDG